MPLLDKQQDHEIKRRQQTLPELHFSSPLMRAISPAKHIQEQGEKRGLEMPLHSMMTSQTLREGRVGDDMSCLCSVLSEKDKMAHILRHAQQ